MNSILNFERMVVQWLVQDYQRRKLRAAVRSAYGSFAKQHPEWVAFLFDEHFVQKNLVPLLESVTDEGVMVTPYQVALLWAQQVSILPTRRLQNIATVMPAATHFLELMADALAEANNLMNMPVSDNPTERWPQQETLTEAAQAQLAC